MVGRGLRIEDDAEAHKSSESDEENPGDDKPCSVGRGRTGLGCGFHVGPVLRLGTTAKRRTKPLLLCRTGVEMRVGIRKETLRNERRRNEDQDISRRSTSRWITGR